MFKKLLPALGLALTTACAPIDLAGEWLGDVDCGGNFAPLDAEMSLEADADLGEFSGDGAFSGTDSQGESFVLSFVIDVELDDPKTRDELATGDGRLDDCTWEGQGDVQCWDVEDLRYASSDEELEATLVNFTGTGTDCDLLIER